MLLFLLTLVDEQYSNIIVFLYNTYKDDMLKYARNKLAYLYKRNDPYHDAEDAVSETYYKIAKNIKLLNFQQPAPMIKSNIYKVLDTVLYDLYADNVEFEYGEIEEAELCREDIIDIVATSYENEAVINAIKKLPDIYNSALSLHYINKLSINDISILLGKPYTTIHKRIATGKALLAKLLRAEGLIHE